MSVAYATAVTPGSGRLDRRSRDVYWIGRGSGAGKSTIARRLAERHDLRVYPTDDVMRDHAARTTPEGSPLLHAFMAMDHDERWATRSPGTMLDTFLWFRGEGYGLMVEDLRRLPPGPAMVTEGFRLLSVIEVGTTTTEAHLLARVERTFRL